MQRSARRRWRAWRRSWSELLGLPTPATRLEPMLAPRVLEPRRLLDAAGPGLALDALMTSGDHVQAAPLAPAGGGGATADSVPAAGSPGNTAPSNLVIAPLAPINEGQVAELLFEFTDPDATDSHTVEIDWGDGSPVESFSLVAGSRFFGTTHQYLDDNPTATPLDLNTIGVKVIDGSGESVEGTATIQVSNVAPSNLQLQLQSVINENNLATLELTFSDPGTLDTHTIEIDWGDGSPIETFALTPGTRDFNTTYQYLDDNPTGTPFDLNTVTVRVIDDDGGVGVATGTILVNNVPPSNLQLQLQSVINENNLATLELTFSDPGTLDTHTIEIDWGDGSPIETFALTLGTRDFNTTHQYLDDNPTGTPFDLNTVTVRVIDDDGGEAVATGVIRVNNVPPSNLVIDPIAAIDENGAATLNLSFVDPGSLDTHTVEIDWGDGSPLQVIAVAPGARTLTAAHQYLDDNPTGTSQDTYAVQVRVLDDDGGEVTGGASVVVRNVAPSNLILQPVATIDENGVATLQLSFDDPGSLDVHTVEIDWGDGSPLETVTLAVGARTLAITHQYLDDNPTGTPTDVYQINVTLRDDDGGQTSAMTTVEVRNVAPSNLVLQPVATIDENGVATLNLSFDDPGSLDVHTVEIDWGDGSPLETVTLAVGARTLAITHQYLDDNPTGTPADVYQVNVTVRDDDSGQAAAMTTVEVRNVAPSNLVLVPPATIDENGVATLQLSFDDPGSLDVHTVEIDWGDGSPLETVTLAVGERTLTITHQYLDDNPTGTPTDVYQINVTLRDDDGGQTSAMTTVEVRNVAPSAVTVAIAPGNEGSVFIAQVDFVDPGSLDTHTVEIDWGDGTATVVGPATGRTFVATHVYADNGTYTVQARVVDDDTGIGLGSAPVVVSNVAPALAVVGDQTIAEGSLLSLAVIGMFTDPGFDNPLNTIDPANGGEVAETFTYTINWGDGTPLDAGVPTIDQVGGVGVLTAGSFGGEHIYADNGVYTVEVRVFDDDGGVALQTFVVTVTNVDPTLTGVDAPLTVDEGQAFTLAGLGVGVTDPGFDNPLNAGNAANGGEVEETFTGVSIDWGDGTPIVPVTVFPRVSGSPGVPTTAGLVHAPHTYADNGLYTVTVQLSDDDGPVVSRTFQIQVNNVAPTLTLTTVEYVINEGQTLVIPDLAAFTDPGFDNPLNAGNAANGGETAELFTYTIDWGDGTPLEFFAAPDVRTSGSPGVLTAGSFAGSHFYADNDADNKYTITVTLYDDDGGVDVKTIEVTVLNVNPTLDPLAATDVTSAGTTTLTLSFVDPGADSFEVLVDWGDKLHLPPADRFVVATVYAGPTPETFVLVHQYQGPPDPLNPAADITITVKIRDDDFHTPGVIQQGESNVQFVVISNPGTGQEFFFVELTARPPAIQFPPRTDSGAAPTESVPPVQSRTAFDQRGAAGEAKVGDERYFELRVIEPDGSQSAGYRLPNDAISDLPGLFRNLPDNRYAIYLVQPQTGSRRLVIEVFVRNGKLIDPGDDTEGARDRPPTDDAAKPHAEPLPPTDETVERRAAEPASMAAASSADPIADAESAGNQRAIAPRLSHRWLLTAAGLALTSRAAETFGKDAKTADASRRKRYLNAARGGDGGRRRPR
ncbi:MAG: PKD domain-containing protein [Pirellulales bacterium]|nr:PKD domain-containing protein [Pirellulales bacterium]